MARLLHRSPKDWPHPFEDGPSLARHGLRARRLCRLRSGITRILRAREDAGREGPLCGGLLGGLVTPTERKREWARKARLDPIKRERMLAASRRWKARNPDPGQW